jgi:hypothetical protein
MGSNRASDQGRGRAGFSGANDHPWGSGAIGALTIFAFLGAIFKRSFFMMHISNGNFLFGALILFLAISELGAGANAATNDRNDVLVGAYYYTTGWHSDPQPFYDDIRQTDDAKNIFKGWWTSVHNHDQNWLDQNDSFFKTSNGFTHNFRKMAWEEKFIFDANQSTMPAGWNFWTMVRRYAILKQYMAPLFGWPQHLDHHLPLSATDGYLGYYDTDQSAVWQTQINAAADHGVDFFAYEMSWNFDASSSKEKKYPSTPIDNGFLQAINRNRIRFAFMWTNHDWGATGNMNYSNDALARFVQFLDRYYFNKSNYLKLDGKPVVYIYNLDTDQSGLMYSRNPDNTVTFNCSVAYNRLSFMRQKAVELGYKGIYVVGMGWADQAKNGGYSGCGLDALTAYNYASWAYDRNYVGSLSSVPTRWRQQADLANARIQPVAHVSVYDDDTSGSRLFSGMDVLNRYGMNGQSAPEELGGLGTNPARYKQLLSQAKAFISERSDADRVIMLQAWNEWGEGNVVEPTQQYGWSYLQAIRSTLGFNPLKNAGLENSDLSPWQFWTEYGAGTFSKVSVNRAEDSSGLYVGRIAGTTQPHAFAYQNIPAGNFMPNQLYRAWGTIKSTNVSGNGARLRIDFRDASEHVLRIDESEHLPANSGFNRLSVTGTIPSGTHHILVAVCGSTDVGSGPGSEMLFDDIAFVTTKPESGPKPTATISAQSEFITGSGSTIVTWGLANVSSGQVYIRKNLEWNETLWQTTPGSYVLNGIAGNTYTINVYANTNHTRLLNSITVTFHPSTPIGWVVDEFADGLVSGIDVSADINGLAESHGTMSFYTTGKDPHAIWKRTSNLTIDTSFFKTLKIRMKVNHGNFNGRLYWYNNDGTWDEQHAQSFTIINDGRWRTYVIDLGTHPYWTGTVTGLRIDPTTAQGARVEIDFIVAQL